MTPKNPLSTHVMPPVWAIGYEDRFWSRVEESPNGCWVWRGGTRNGGYPTVYPQSSRQPENGNRVAWLLSRGPIPEGLVVCHTCDNPPCINPDHLWLGTRADNAADMLAKGRHRPGRGERQGNAKITWAIAAQIRASTESIHAASRRIGVSRNTIRRVRRFENWNPEEAP